jgi:hypothetical protein
VRAREPGAVGVTSIAVPGAAILRSAPVPKIQFFRPRLRAGEVARPLAGQRRELAEARRLLGVPPELIRKILEADGTSRLSQGPSSASASSSLHRPNWTPRWLNSPRDFWFPTEPAHVSESAVRDIGLMYLAKLEQRSSGEASIERDVIGFGEPDEREE